MMSRETRHAESAVKPASAPPADRSPPVAARRRRRGLSPAALSGAGVALALGGLGAAILLGVKQQMELAPPPPATPTERAAGLPGATAKWKVTQAQLAQRLHQRDPLELGLVWVTRTGQVCGLVNGRDSFGGLTSMMRFYKTSGEPVLPGDDPAFNTQWVDCKADHFIIVHEGSDLKGFCGSGLGQKRCITVGG